MLCVFVMEHALKGRFYTTAILLALVSYLDIFHMCLVMPAALLLRRSQGTTSSTTKSFRKSEDGTAIMRLVIAVGAIWSCLLFISYALMGSWDFVGLRSGGVYGFALRVEDLEPNIGLFWYMFTMVFPEYRQLFLFAFHGHWLACLVPLSIRLRLQPAFLYFYFLGILLAFHPYPSTGSLALFLSLSPMFAPIIGNIRILFLIVTGYLVGIVIGPITLSLWLQTGTANANAFYAATLIFNVSHVVFMTHCLKAMLTLQYQVNKQSDNLQRTLTKQKES
eukprot:CAMPEP_0184652096 /NCGR_PEP_ID=MMETSP0308-20130426/9770_1 /TAXON_ID=38269 /ORGANISM="Gloeochaete witrockiana, Strain SAG 46.84" /LENGTH=277 /DNA_ID=CAMNT_0027086757 /DNA_START=580 /DNA_END=1413 /DNA_ORIENTATION=-